VDKSINICGFLVDGHISECVGMYLSSSSSSSYGGSGLSIISSASLTISCITCSDRTFAWVRRDWSCRECTPHLLCRKIDGLPNCKTNWSNHSFIPNYTSHSTTLLFYNIMMNTN